MGEGFTWDVQDRQRDIAAARQAWQRSCAMILDPQFDFVLLDELNIALRNDYLDVAEVVAFLRAAAARQAHLHHRTRRAAALAGDRRSRHRGDARRSIRIRPATRRSGESSFENSGCARCCCTLAACECARTAGASAHRASCADRLAESVPRRDSRRAGADRPHRCDQSLFARSCCARRLPSWRSACRSPTRSAEEIVALRPDLVLASRHSAIPTRNALRRVGIHYELFDVAFSVEDSLAQIRRIAALVGNAAAGEALVARIERAIETARLPPGTRRLTAAVYETGGLTAGSKTVTDELMQIVGLDNLAARYGIQMHAPMQLELLVAAPPDLLLMGEVPAAAGTQAARIVQHRALRKVPSTALGVSGALHVLLRADDHRRSRRARRAHATPSMRVLARRPHDDNATLDHAVAARTRGAARDRVHRRRPHRARLERLALPGCDRAHDPAGAAIAARAARNRDRRSARAGRRGVARLSAQSARRSRHARYLIDGGVRRGAEHLLRRRRSASVGSAVERRRAARSSAWPRCSCSPA